MTMMLQPGVRSSSRRYGNVFVYKTVHIEIEYYLHAWLSSGDILPVIDNTNLYHTLQTEIF